MPDLTRDSDRIVADAQALVEDNRAGGRHRSAPRKPGAGKAIGRGSAELRARHWMRKALRMGVATCAILIAASVAGLVLGGIGFWGVVITVITITSTLIALGVYPRMTPPKRADLNEGDVRQMVGKTELWLEHQQLALPAPAARIVDDMGVQLDALGEQLETIDQSHPAAREVRKLVGEVLPETVESYRRIPEHLRHEDRVGGSPDAQLTESLGRISSEIDSVTRQLAEGSLDDLAIRHRYLDYRYGEGETTAPEEKR